MHNLFSNEEEGLDKIHDGRFPAFSVPFILLVPVAILILSRGRHFIEPFSSQVGGHLASPPRPGTFSQ
jgi:hypothetical protein